MACRGSGVRVSLAPFRNSVTDWGEAIHEGRFLLLALESSSVCPKKCPNICGMLEARRLGRLNGLLALEGVGLNISERSAAEACELHGLSNGCSDCSHLVGLCSLLHHAMQHLQQLGGVLLTIDIEVLNDLLVGFMDIEVC